MIKSFDEFISEKKLLPYLSAGLIASSTLLPLDKKEEPIKNTEKEKIETVSKDNRREDEKTVKVEKPAAKAPKKFEKIKGMPKNFDIVPAGTNVYRSDQPSLKQLEQMIKHYGIKRVIRMNAKEDTDVTPQQEKKLVESLGAEYFYINAHEGYVEGKGYVKSLRKIQPLLKKGDVLIHCTHGADRTGYQVGKFVMNEKGWSSEKVWEYTTKYSNWKTYIPKYEKNKEKYKEYVKYMEAFYPYKEWKKVHGKPDVKAKASEKAKRKK